MAEMCLPDAGAATRQQPGPVTAPALIRAQGAQTPVRVLVIGYGNTLRGDDGFGPCAAEQLAATLPTEYVTIMTCHQLTLDLAEIISRADCVILLDAAVGETPGQIAWMRVTPRGDQPHTMLHYMEPGALLAGTQALYGKIPPTYLWTVVGTSFDYTETLSPAVERAIPEVIERLKDFIFGNPETGRKDN